ncbi:hypothetical protein Dimus_030917, partial [Dionaea muscipula]
MAAAALFADMQHTSWCTYHAWQLADLSAGVKMKQSSHELLIAAARSCIALCGRRGKSSRIGKHVTSFASLRVVLKQTYNLDNDELAPL